MSSAGWLVWYRFCTVCMAPRQAWRGWCGPALWCFG